MEPDNHLMIEIRDDLRRALMATRRDRTWRMNIASTLWLINCIIRAQELTKQTRDWVMNARTK